MAEFNGDGFGDSFCSAPDQEIFLKLFHSLCFHSPIEARHAIACTERMPSKPHRIILRHSSAKSLIVPLLQLCSRRHAISTGKKYGGLAPRKKPLISKDNERAFFDSADWALCKQGAPGGYQNTMAMVETLRPKLQRTQRQQLPPRRPACTSGQDNLVLED